MASKVCDEVEKLITPIVKDLGYFIVDIEYSKKFDGMNLEITIDREGGVDINDCEKVHNVLSAMLDTIDDEFDDDYVLNVSSQGLDRKIVTDDDFRRALDTEIELFDANKKKSHGTLLSFDDENIVIKTDGKNPKETKIQRNLLTKVQPYVRF